MPTLSSFVRERMKELGLTNKQVAAAVHDDLKLGGEDVKFETIVQKLSKLLHDDPEGVGFFLKTDARTRTLASAIKSDPERLRALAERVALVLDPRLPGEVVAYLQRRSEEGEAIACTSISLGGGESEGEQSLDARRGKIREALRDAARKHSRALVVTVSSDDDDFYSGAGVTATRVEASPRGFVLTAAPELVPLPPPAPPELLRDGRPRVSCTELTNLILDARSESKKMYGDPIRALIEHLECHHPKLRSALSNWSLPARMCAT